MNFCLKDKLEPSYSYSYLKEVKIRTISLPKHHSGGRHELSDDGILSPLIDKHLCTVIFILDHIIIIQKMAHK